MASRRLRELLLFLLFVAAYPAHVARAEMSAEELAKLAQNPVGNLISLPFQNNANLNYGPLRKTQNILNIQPVIPIERKSSVTNEYRHRKWNGAVGPSAAKKERMEPLRTRRRRPVFARVGKKSARC